MCLVFYKSLICQLVLLLANANLAKWIEVLYKKKNPPSNSIKRLKHATLQPAHTWPMQKVNTCTFLFLNRSPLSGLKCPVNISHKFIQRHLSYIKLQRLHQL